MIIYVSFHNSNGFRGAALFDVTEEDTMAGMAGLAKRGVALGMSLQDSIRLNLLDDDLHVDYEFETDKLYSKADLERIFGDLERFPV